MAKRHRSSDDESDRGSSRWRCPAQRHLCVVLDDWSKGYSIYKLDVDGFDGDPDDADLDLNADRLPGPPAFRLEVPEDERGRFARFAAAGSRILALQYSEEDRDAPVLVYDLATGGLAVGPVTPVDLQNRPKLVAAGDMVYAVDWRGGRRDHHSFTFEALAPHGRRGWVWSSLPAAPFDLAAMAACHAAHPDGRTVFFSAHGKGTFSFDAEAEEWAWRGDWMLPFRGQAYYDAELDAWVGLRCGGVAEGLVCSCQVFAVARGAGRQQEPEWKAAQVIETDDERSMAVELAHVGDGKFCLVECRQRRDRNLLHGDGDDGRWLLFATTFGLRYDKDGALRPTARRARCYAVHKKSNTFQWRAFGMKLTD